jgi:hypothetical protein
LMRAVRRRSIPEPSALSRASRTPKTAASIVMLYDIRVHLGCVFRLSKRFDRNLADLAVLWPP